MWLMGSCSRNVVAYHGAFVCFHSGSCEGNSQSSFATLGFALIQQRPSGLKVDVIPEVGDSLSPTTRLSTNTGEVEHVIHVAMCVCVV